MKLQNMPPVVVLLGGENSRFWPLGVARHKALYEVGLGKPVLYYLFKEFEKAGIRKVILVKRSKDQGLDEFLAGAKFGFRVFTVLQQEPKGMADALLVAESLLKERSFFVVDGNQINFASIAQGIIAFRNPQDYWSEETDTTHGAVVVRETNAPDKFGIVVTGTGGTIAIGGTAGKKDHGGHYLFEIVEKPQNLKPPQLRIVACYYLRREFMGYVCKYRGNCDSGFEAALTEYAKHYPVFLFEISDDPSWVRLPLQDVSLKYPWDLLKLHEVIVRRELSGKGAFVHKSASIHPSAVIDDTVYIDEGARIMEFAVVKNYSVVSKNAVVGSHSLVRDYSLIGERAVVGAHSEVTRSILCAGAHTHENYVGDSILDRGVHLGAGTRTGNRRLDRGVIKSSVKGKRVLTGRKSLGVVMGENVHTGINCSLMPGVKIGRNSVVYAHTMVDSDIEEDTILKADGTLIRGKIKRSN